MARSFVQCFLERRFRGSPIIRIEAFRTIRLPQPSVMDTPTSGAAMSWVGFGSSPTNADWLRSSDTSLMTRWTGEHIFPEEKKSGRANTFFRKGAEML